MSTADDRRHADVERMLEGASRPAADPAFRARLRTRFLEGGAETLLRPEPGAERAGSSGPMHAVPDELPGPTRERTNLFPLLWPAVLAASVAALLWFVISRDAVVKWRVLDLPPDAQYIVDGIAVNPADQARLVDLLQTAHEISTDDHGLRVQLLDQVVLDLGPHTRVSQLTFPASGSWSIHADAGSLRIATGPGFPGRRLSVLTDEMEAQVTGTILAIDVIAKGTCLCCLHGTVMCDAHDGTKEHAVESGGMGFAYKGGKPADWGSAFEPHVVPMRELESAIAKHGWNR